MTGSNANAGGPRDMTLELATMRAVMNKINNYKNAQGEDIVWPFRNKVPIEVSVVPKRIDHHADEWLP